MGYTRIDNSLLELLYSNDLCGSELRVALFILRQTTGWNIDKKYMTNSYIANGTGIPIETVRRAIRRLREKNILNFGMDKAVKNERNEVQKCTPPCSKMNTKEINKEINKIISKEKANTPRGDNFGENQLQVNDSGSKKESEWDNDF